MSPDISPLKGVSSAKPIQQDDIKSPVRFTQKGAALSFLSNSGLFFAIVLICVIGSFVHPAFLSVTNFLNVLNSMSIVGIVVIGMTFVLVSGGLADLCVPATIACGAILSLALQPVLGPYGAALIALLVAGLCGVFTGILVGYIGLNAIIASLAVGSIVLGGVQASVGGVIIYNTHPEVTAFLKSRIFGMPMVIVIFAAVGLAGHFVLSQTRFGRWVYATGGNYKAARASAVPVRAVRMWAFIFTALCAGLSGILLGLTIQSARPLVGLGYEFSAITAVVVGGTSILGGFGTIPRAVAGLVFVQLLTNVMTLQGIPTPIQGLFIGLLILIAVALDVRLRTRNAT